MLNAQWPASDCDGEGFCVALPVRSRVDVTWDGKPRWLSKQRQTVTKRVFVCVATASSGCAATVEGRRAVESGLGAATSESALRSADGIGLSEFGCCRPIAHRRPHRVWPRSAASRVAQFQCLDRASGTAQGCGCLMPASPGRPACAVRAKHHHTVILARLLL